MNAVNTTFQYEQATNRLHELTTAIPASGTAQDFVYGYDNNGNITSIQDNVDPTQSQAFQYDWLNRLTNAQGAYGNLSYNPDATGDIDNPATANSAYKQQQQALTYDLRSGAGQFDSGVAPGCTRHHDNRIEQLISGGATNSFVYDYTGARVMKNNTVTYVNKFFEIRNGINYKYIFAGGSRIATIIGTSIYFCHPDHLGSLRIATDINANKVQTVAYDPYGNVDPNHSSGSIVPYTFTGKELDSETGLYYFGARYYDSAQGRFLTPDTMVQSPGNPQTLNRYAYCGNNPLAFVDPTGHSWLSDAFNWGMGLLESVFEPFIAMFAGAVVTAFAGPVAGGMVSGAIMGAFSGNIASVVMGAWTGGLMGALPSPINIFAQAGLFGYAVARNGTSALAGFAVGFIGSMAGASAGSAVGDYLNNAINSSVDGSGYQSNMKQCQTDPDCWTYHQQTGEMYYQPPASLGGGPPQLVGVGAAGNGVGENNPDYQYVPNTGPLPQGEYHIGRFVENYTGSEGYLGDTIFLNADPDTYLGPRTDTFRIHEDLGFSNGCPVFSDDVVRTIAKSPDKTLWVVP